MSRISTTGSYYDSQKVQGAGARPVGAERSQQTGGRLLPNFTFNEGPAYTVEISAAGMAAYLRSVRKKKQHATLKDAKQPPQAAAAKQRTDLGQFSMKEILRLVARGSLTSEQAAEELQNRQREGKW